MAKGSMIPKGYEVYFKWGLAIILLMIGVPWVYNWVKKLKEDAARNDAVTNAPGNVARNNPPAGSTSALALKVKGWADSLHDCFDSFLNRAVKVKKIFDEMLNPEDVAAVSEYFARIYSKSLLAETKDEMESWASVCGFKNLSEMVRNNLF